MGCGKMGSILLENLIAESGFKANQITVIEKADKNKIPLKDINFNYSKNTSTLPSNYKADLVFIAIKPQDCEKTLVNFAKENIFHADTIFISILAGKKISFFEKIFSTKAKIIRSMPNLPIQDSQGIFTYLANKNLKTSELKNLQKIFQKFGQVLEIKDENLFDDVTAIFGSGPAYVFLLQEIFTEIVIASGIDKDKAADLIKTLFLGSALMSCNSDLDFIKLRESVTSKAGTTEAALEILQKNSALKNIFTKAIKSASTRSKELSK